MRKYVLAVAAMVVVAGCATPPPPPSAVSTRAPAKTAVETPIPKESSPAGDIPDTQAFVAYRSIRDGFSIDVPEGWSRADSPSGVRFDNKFDGLSLSVQRSPLKDRTPLARGSAVRDVKSQYRQLPGGRALVLTYTSNSEPNAVTGKRVRLTDAEYVFTRGGKIARLRMWAPEGADNVDQWQRIARSFRWR